MLYKGYFSSNKDVEYYVEIQTGTTTTPVDLTFSGNPCIISTSSSGLFTPIKSRGCTLEIVSKEYLMDMYTPSSRGATVKVMLNTTGFPVIFRGYLTPCTYDQSYTYLDAIQLEAVDAISTCKDFKWVNTNKYESFFDIIISILKSAGYRGNLYIPRTYSHINETAVTGDVLDKLFASSTNFLDDNEERTPWTEYAVIEEIMKFLGWSLCPYGDDVWCIDYRASANDNVVYSVYDIQTGTEGNTFTADETISIELSDMAAGEAKLSLDDIYNKIEISDNLYKIDEIAPDIYDSNIHISINEEQDFHASENIWSKVDRWGWLWWYHEQERNTGYDYQTICRLDENSGWKHYFYKRNTLEPCDSYYTSSTSIFNGGDTYYINKFCNTTGCLIQHHAYVEATGNQLPSSLDWDNLLTFFILDDTCNIEKINDVFKWELPVLEYTTGEEIMFKPSSGTTYITIKGDLFYQNNRGYSESKKKEVITVINYDSNPPYYATAPIDKGTDIKKGKYFGNCIYRQIDKHNQRPTHYGEGWPIWKMKLQIDDKFWNGSQWEQYSDPINDPDNINAPTFYIYYNNGPTYEAKAEEYITTFDWISPVNNPENNYKDKTGVDGYCIPIKADDANAPIKGILKLTIYIPSLLPHDNDALNRIAITYQLIKDAQNDWLLRNSLLQWIGGNDYQFSNETVPWCIFCKDFELGVIYSDTHVWWNSHDNDNNDIVYTGYIDDNYKQEFDGIECKLNTTTKDHPISRSYVTIKVRIDEDTVIETYLETMKHVVGDEEKVQEYNLVDMYLDHNSERRTIYEQNVHGLYPPYKKLSSTEFNNLMIDTQSYNFKKDNNNIKFIEF